MTNVDMVIAQISDTHILARSADETIGKHRADNLRRCVADINRRQPDVVVHTGDIVHQGRLDEYAHVREILGPLQAPHSRIVPPCASTTFAIASGRFDGFLTIAVNDSCVKLA